MHSQARKHFLNSNWNTRDFLLWFPGQQYNEYSLTFKLFEVLQISSRVFFFNTQMKMC